MGPSLAGLDRAHFGGAPVGRLREWTERAGANHWHEFAAEFKRLVVRHRGLPDLWNPSFGGEHVC